MVVPDNKRLQYLSWLTLFGMSAIGIVLINYWQNRDAETVLTSGKTYYVQGLSGIFFGSLASLFAAVLIKIKRFKGTRSFFENMIGNINPSFAHILFYSVCAAIGEEILFRAGIQPMLGIWPTALLFVFLHGYINPGNLNLTIYGVFLIIICAGFGYLFKFFGIVSAIVAHFIYDVAMFSILKYSNKKEPVIQAT